MKKMYQFFVSSTFIDLSSIRNLAYQTILGMGQIPVGYDDIASEKGIKESIFPLINNSEVFIIIIGERYGSITNSGFSHIEEEYNYALSKSKPIMCFINSDYARVDDSNFQLFVNKLLKNHLVALWNSENDFKAKLATSIYSLITKSPPDTYWVKQSARRTTTNSEVDKYYNDVADAIGLSDINKDDNDILGLIALNLKEIKEFYTLTKKQAIRAFTLSVSMCIAGFLLIGFASIISLLWNQNQIAIATGIGGAIVEVIAGTSLFVYKKSLEQLNFYYLSLHDNERLMFLINISSKTDSKDELYSRIVISELKRLKNLKRS